MLVVVVGVRVESGVTGVEAGKGMVGVIGAGLTELFKTQVPLCKTEFPLQDVQRLETPFDETQFVS